jgi:ATP-binding cassette, subfamily B, putative efflux pump
MSDAAVKEDTSKNSLIQQVLGKNTFDDRVDTQPDINTAASFVILGRCLKLLASVKGLVITKFFLQLGLVFPALLLPWMAKIVIDNVILQRPFGDTAVVYPPFMNPIVNTVDGMSPISIMLTLTTIYFVMLMTIGSRAGGTGAGLLQGRDAATQAENTLSQGSSSGGGIWGIAEFLVHVRITQTIANNLRSQLFERLTHLPMTVLDDQRIGDSVFRVLYDTPEAADLAFRLTFQPFFLALAAAINLYILQYSFGDVSPELIWIAWGMLPLFILGTAPFSGALRRTNQNKRAAGAATTNAMEESMNNIGAVQSLGGNKKEEARFAERSAQTFLRERYAWAVIIATIMVLSAIAGVAAIYVTILITDRIIEGDLSPGDFAVLMGVYGGIAGPASFFGMFWLKLQENIAAVRRVFFFLDYESEEVRPDGVKLGTIQGGVTFEAAGFAYPDGQKALNDINLELHMGELVALVGPTGAGKTTLAYMIPALLTPTSGRVMIDGQSLAEVDLDSLRNQVTYVFQEHLLLSESIRENLLLANPGASEAEMLASLRTAGCMEFINELPQGIDTVLGRSGDTLSVGQQQRLSIARGLVRDSKILILDEPTAALDPHTEGQLVTALQAAAKGRLVIVIAHRLSTIRKADRIVFLEHGEIKDVGDHSTLMAKPDGPYREFVELQSG